MADTLRPRFWQAAAAVLLLTVFWLDTVTPEDVGVSALYVLPTILFVGGSTFTDPLIVAAIATVLTAAGFYVSSPDGPSAAALINRGVDAVAIWGAAGLVIGYVGRVRRWSERMIGANAALEQSMRRLEALEYALDQSAIVAATDQKGVITYVNEKFCAISQYSRQELLGQDHRIINSGYHSKEFIRTLWRTIAQGQVWHGELRNRAKDGTIYWVDTTIVPFLNQEGKPWQYMAIRYDITQRKAAEAQLRDEAALTQLGRLAAVVAHEVRNPLAALKGSLQILASRLPADLPGREIIAPMLARIDALNRTVQDILTYSKPSPPKRQRFDIATLLKDVVSAARAAAPGAAIDVTAAPAPVSLDPEMTHAVLLNLLMNACQAGGSPPIEVHSTLGDGCCEIRILDRGHGIPSGIREHLFEPFVTTRSGGTGLGLAIARRLVQLQGGTLALEDRPGGGTAAVVRLPTTTA